jgi:putative transposase
MADYLRWFVPGATYFFTVVTYNRYPYFRDSRAVDLLREAWQNTQRELAFENIASVLLPDHFHCLWTLPPRDSDYSIRLKRIKDQFTVNWIAQGGHEEPVTPSQARRGNRGIWQRRFWEHTIRDEDDLEKHFDYIHFNPVKHGYAMCPFDWPDSTFHRYVTSGHYSPNWGRQCPIDIKDMNWE